MLADTHDDIRANAAGGIFQMGPWLPKNRFTANGMLIDRANPFRGRFAPTTASGLGVERFHIDDQRRAVSGSETATRFDLLHPELEALLTSDALSGSSTPNVPLPISEYFISRANQVPALAPNLDVPLEVLHLFGGDWNPTLPCRKPTEIWGKFRLNPGSSAIVPPCADAIEGALAPRAKAEGLGGARPRLYLPANAGDLPPVTR